MKPELQRIKIAEACGWRYAGPPDAKEHAVACWYAPGDMEWHQRLLPDYLNDLNAMHEAENMLFKQGWEWQVKFYNQLLGITGCFNTGIYATHATAAQRAEAFLRTLNLWEAKP